MQMLAINTPLVLAPRVPLPPPSRCLPVPRPSGPLSPPLLCASGRGEEKDERHPGHDDTAPEEIIDPDSPARQHYAHAAL